MPSDQEWQAHLRDSAQRARDLESRDKKLEAAIEELTTQMVGLRLTVESFANRQAQARAAAQVSRNVPDPMDVTATHRNLYALSAAEASDAIASLSVWKARPTLVVGFVGAMIALAVSFGLPITKEQTGAILAAVFAALTLAASMRGQRTTAALVRAGERRGALAGPESVK